jgi:hypothetical protein
VGLELPVTRPTAVRSVVGIGVDDTNDAKTGAALAGLAPGHLEQRAPAVAAALARRHDSHHAPGYWRDLLRWIPAANAAAPVRDRLAFGIVPSSDTVDGPVAA